MKKKIVSSLPGLTYAPSTGLLILQAAPGSLGPRSLGPAQRALAAGFSPQSWNLGRNFPTELPNAQASLGVCKPFKYPHMNWIPGKTRLNVSGTA